MAKKETERLHDQCSKLGELGLAAKAKILEDAIAENELLPSKELLTSVPVPSTKSIQFHPVSIFKSSDKISSTEIVDLSQLPFYCELYDLKSSFVYVNIQIK